MLTDSRSTRLALSTRIPNGMAASAPTSDDAVTSRPSSAVPIPSAGCNWGAMAPIELLSAAPSPSTSPSSRMTLRRAGPPSRAVSWSSAPWTRRPSHGRA